ncbi:MAG: family 10 glycosylhydrolase, partial [Candidatus Neomarinimicrobiota bacterium]
SPGIPAVREHILAVVSDIASRYTVDGIHLDYVRYPDRASTNGLSRDAISVARFNSPPGNPQQLDWDDWQREQITMLVIGVFNRVTAIDSSIKLSAAVLGSYISTSWNAYGQVYQDPRRWSELGKIDFITPMIYWPRDHHSQPFLERSQEWRDHYALDRYVFPGIGSYRYNEKTGSLTWDEAQGQIDDLRRERFPGLAFFDARSLEGHWSQLSTGRFRFPANIPALPWKDNQRPGPPESLILTSAGDHRILTWVAPADEDVVRFNVYFSENLPIDRTNGRNLRHVTNGPRLEWVFSRDSLLESGHLAVSALDAAWNESPLSTPIQWPGR